MGFAHLDFLLQFLPRNADSVSMEPNRQTEWIGSPEGLGMGKFRFLESGKMVGEAFITPNRMLNIKMVTEWERNGTLPSFHERNRPYG
jgi:hypothetical protein